MMKKLLIVNFLMIFCLNCETNTLSKEEVLKICLDDKQLVEHCIFNIDTKIIALSSKIPNEVSQSIQELESQGLITSRKYTDRQKYGFATLINNVIEFQPTELAISEYGFENMKFSKAKVLYSKGKVTEVLGVSLSESKNEAKALLLISYIKTPFAILNGEFYNPHSCNNLPLSIEKEITLIKYDTGWRIKKEVKEEQSLF